MIIPDYIDSLPGYRELDDATRFAICNGCGSAKAKIDLVPDNILGLPIYHACAPHDYAFWLGKTIEDKRKADLQFLCNLMSIINAESVWFLKLPRRRIALTYYSAVCDLGEKAFWEGKERPTSVYIHD